MTGRDLIVYILENGLEDEPIVQDGKLIGFLTMSEVAVRFGVGLSTVGVWIFQGKLHCVKIGGTFYIPVDADFREVETYGS